MYNTEVLGHLCKLPYRLNGISIPCFDCQLNMMPVSGLRNYFGRSHPWGLTGDTLRFELSFRIIFSTPSQSNDYMVSQITTKCELLNMNQQAGAPAAAYTVLKDV